jgi:hypothetical protein
MGLPLNMLLTEQAKKAAITDLSSSYSTVIRYVQLWERSLIVLRKFVVEYARHGKPETPIDWKRGAASDELAQITRI